MLLLFDQLRWTIGMAQLPRRMGQLQERMRFRTSERWMSAKSRAHFPRRAWWYASAADPALTTNRDYSSSAIAFSATSLSCLHANHSAISTPAGASRTSFRLTQLSLQEAGSGIGFGPGSRQYGRRSGTEWRFRLGSRRQVSQSPSHICSGRFLNDVAMTLWFFQSGWVKIRRNASAEEKMMTHKLRKESASTLVPRFNSSRANGNTPRMTSSPLLSTKMAAHRWAPSSSRTSQSSTWSMNHGLSMKQKF